MRRLLTRLLLTVSLALAPALAFQAYSEREAHRIRRQLIEDEALRLLRLVIAEQQRITEGAQQALNAIASDPAVQDNETERCQRILANLLRRDVRYSDAAVIGLDGHPLCAPTPFDPATDLSDRAFFRLALQSGGFVVGEYGRDRTTGQPVLQMAEPFQNRAGQVAGVVTVDLSLAWLGQQLDRLPLPPHAAVSITDRDGSVVARTPDGTRYLGLPDPAATGPDAAGEQSPDAKPRVTERRGLDGAPRIVASAPPGRPTGGLRVGVGLDRDATFAAVTQANRTGLLLIFLGAGLALATTALVGRRLIGRPVARLLTAAERWRSGDLAARTGLRDDGTDFGRLGAAFDSMAAALAERERSLRDLTEDLEKRVHAEADAREAAQQRAAHGERIQALGQLAGGIAHDFNNVLQTLEGAVTLIERYPGDEHGVQRLARLCLGAIARGASVTRRLLAFGHRGTLQSTALDPADLLGGLREILQHTLGAATTIALQVDPDTPPLLADKAQLETALVNLATNARDAMPNGGTLTLAASPDTVPANAPPHPAGLTPGAYVRLAVTDTGTGMDEKVLARVTEPFFTTKPPGAGTGLGLAMVHGFAAQSGGGLHITSTPGTGTTVTLWLPQATADVGAAK